VHWPFVGSHTRGGFIPLQFLGAFWVQLPLQSYLPGWQVLVSQAWPMRESQAVLQVPLWHTFPLLQAEPQQGWLSAPQALHVPLWQTLPELQVVPQQGWPVLPHDTHELPEQIFPLLHDVESQMQLPPEQCRPLLQDICVPPHVPFWQVSFWVQASPSLQVPPVFAGLLHVPVLGLQVPTLWQTSWAVHTTGFWRWQVPMHTSEPLQGLPSSVQVLPLQQAWPWAPH
jgi:hypothetical protein